MRVGLFLLFLICGSVAFGQKTVYFEEDNPAPAFKERIFFGGGVGFGAGSGFTSIQVNPIVGYMITRNLSAGIGVEYQYVKYKDFDYSDNLWGGQLFTRYNIRQFFLQGEYNIYSFRNYPGEGRSSADRVLLGGGITQPIGRAGALNLVALYDVLYTSGGPFGSPWVFRIYFSF